jgi:hypothetical protein
MFLVVLVDQSLEGGALGVLIPVPHGDLDGTRRRRAASSAAGGEDESKYRSQCEA